MGLWNIFLPWGAVVCQLGSIEEQGFWLGLLLGHYRCEHGLVPMIHVLVLQDPFLFHHSQIPSGWTPQNPMQPLWCNIRVGVRTDWPTMLGGGAGCPSWVLFFCWRKWRLREDRWHGVVLALGKGNAINMYCFSYPSNEVSHGLCGCLSFFPIF